MKRTALVLMCCCCCGGAPAADWRALDGRTLAPAVIDAEVARLVAANRVTGFAIALIDSEGRVPYLRTFGRRDVEANLPLEPDTVMYAASFTKGAFGYFALQLVDEGKLDLDRSIAASLPQPLPEYEKYRDLAGDERWRKLTPRILLSHTSGFANFAFLDPEGKIRFRREPGARFGYSGEGINLLQFAMNTNNDWLGAEMQRRVFDRFGMTRTSMVWRPGFASNFAQGYDLDGRLYPHRRRNSPRAAGSMDTTIADWSRFIGALLRGDGLSARARRELTRRQIAIDSATEFPSLTEARTRSWRRIRLGYGLGWGVFQSPFGPAFFKEGHDDGTSNYVLCVEGSSPRRACVAMMSNSNRAEGIFLHVANFVLGRTGLPWQWSGYEPFDGRRR